MATNPYSAINLSIDAGTPDTWYKVKGVNNFDKVTDNLVKYFKSSSRPGQITLKYIVLPDINDNYEDFSTVIEIMKILGVKHLSLSLDNRTKYSDFDEQRQKVIGAAGYLIAMLHNNNLTFDMFTYSPDEREKAVVFAKQLLSSREI